MAGEVVFAADFSSRSLTYLFLSAETGDFLFDSLAALVQSLALIVVLKLGHLLFKSVMPTLKTMSNRANLTSVGYVEKSVNILLS